MRDTALATLFGGSLFGLVARPPEEDGAAGATDGWRVPEVIAAIVHLGASALLWWSDSTRRWRPRDPARTLLTGALVIADAMRAEEQRPAAALAHRGAARSFRTLLDGVCCSAR